MNKIAIKYFAFAVIAILLVSTASASFATIGKIGLKYGLKFVDPAIGDAVNVVLCVANVVGCVQGQVAGEVMGKAYDQALGAVSQVAGKEAAQKAAEAFSTYNQMQGYIQDGAAVAQEFKVKDDGYVESGALSVKQADGTEIQISLKNVRPTYEQEIIPGTDEPGMTPERTGPKLAKYTFGESGELKIGNVEIRNVEKGSTVTTDKNGRIVGAKLLVGKDGGEFSLPQVEKITAYAGSQTTIDYVCNDDYCHATAAGDFEYLGKSFSGAANLRNNIADGSFDIKENGHTLSFVGKVTIEDKGYTLGYSYNSPVIGKVSIDGKVNFISEYGDMFITTNPEFDKSKHPSYAGFFNQNGNDVLSVKCQEDYPYIVEVPKGAKWTNMVPTRLDATLGVEKGQALTMSENNIVRLENGKLQFANKNIEMEFNDEDIKSNPIREPEGETDPRTIYSGKNIVMLNDDNSVECGACPEVASISGQTILGMAIKTITGKSISITGRADSQPRCNMDLLNLKVSTGAVAGVEPPKKGEKATAIITPQVIGEGVSRKEILQMQQYYQPGKIQGDLISDPQKAAPVTVNPYGREANIYFVYKGSEPDYEGATTKTQLFDAYAETGAGVVKINKEKLTNKYGEWKKVTYSETYHYMETNQPADLEQRYKEHIVIVKEQATTKDIAQLKQTGYKGVYLNPDDPTKTAYLDPTDNNLYDITP